jgi:hypothetical protein
MARWHPSTCRVCGRSEKTDVGVTISATGLCPEHGHARFEENLDGLKTKRGPFAHWWAYRLAVGVGWGPLDGAPPRP